MHGGICYLLFGWCWSGHKSPTPIACTLLSDAGHATFRFPVLAALLCYKKGGLVCKSGCHGCPALLRRTGPLAPHDNHSLAEGHRFGPILASNLLLCCWSAHKSLAPRTRTLLGVLGQATLNFVAVATLLFCFFCECPKFCDLAKQRRKMFLGVSEVGRINFALYFFWLCVFFVVFYILLLRSRDNYGVPPLTHPDSNPFPLLAKQGRSLGPSAGTSRVGGYSRCPSARFGAA